MIYPKDLDDVEAVATNKLSAQYGLLPSWIPVLFSIITPMSFTANHLLAKSFRQGPVKFNIQEISFSGFFAVNAVLLLPSLYYWFFISFSMRLFIIGFFGSIINTFGKVCVQNAVARGPAGPASALLAMNSLILLVYDGIKNNTAPTLVEIVGLILGLFGSLMLVVPGMFERLCKCCLGGGNPKRKSKKKKRSKSKTGDESSASRELD